MIEGMLDILWENYNDQNAIPRFKLHFINIHSKSHGAIPCKIIVDEKALEEYLLALTFTPGKAKEWIKKVKTEKSVSIQTITIPEQYANEYEK